MQQIEDHTETTQQETPAQLIARAQSLEFPPIGEIEALKFFRLGSGQYVVRVEDVEGEVVSEVLE